MKQFFKMFFASMLAIIISSVVVILIIIGMVASAVNSQMNNKKEVTVAEKSVLYIDMASRFHEQGETNPFGAIFNDASDYSAGLYDVVRSLEHAKNDDRIEGIYLRLAPSPNGWATLQELRNAIVDFKQSGKFVYAYGERITQSTYFVATAADSIYLNPVGDMDLKGFATVLAFFKGTLDKLDVEPQIFYAGKFKSATEPFRTTQMSDANRQQITEFQSDFWSQFTQAVASFTGTDTAAVTLLAKNGTIEFPEDALNNKLVSGLLYADEVRARLRKKVGLEDDDKIKTITISKYADKVLRKSVSGERIAVVYAEGGIVDGEAQSDYEVASRDMTDIIRKLRKDDNVKAVVLRVNSPGGSALASEVILRELQLLKAEKPLVVSMGDLAASGGYYISCQADSIFAMPNTITGSIGVFTMMFNTSKLMENKLGITFDEVKNAPYADFPSGARTITADEAKRMQNSVDKIYTIFKSRVAKGRKMSIDSVDVIAQGRVWTGSDALELGLVDGLGDLNRAIQSAASLANMDDYKIATYPDPADQFKRMLKMFGGASMSTTAAKVAEEYELSEEYKMVQTIRNFKRTNGKTMMMMPFEMMVK